MTESSTRTLVVQKKAENEKVYNVNESFQGNVEQ